MEFLCLRRPARRPHGAALGRSARRAGPVRILDAPAWKHRSSRRPARRLPELDFEPVANARERQRSTGMIAARSTSPTRRARVLYEPEERWRTALEPGWLFRRRAGDLRPPWNTPARGHLFRGDAGRHRRQGCAEAVVRHAVAEPPARLQPGRLVLQSTPDGRRLTALGLRRTTRFAGTPRPEPVQAAAQILVETAVRPCARAHLTNAARNFPDARTFSTDAAIPGPGPQQFNRQNRGRSPWLPS